MLLITQFIEVFRLGIWVPLPDTYKVSLKSNCINGFIAKLFIDHCWYACPIAIHTLVFKFSKNLRTGVALYYDKSPNRLLIYEDRVDNPSISQN